MWTNENRARYDRSHLRYPSDLSDDEWKLVEPLIPPVRRDNQDGNPHPDCRATRQARAAATNAQ
jgi:transposase